MKVNKIELNKVSLNRVQINTVGIVNKSKGEAPPEQEITDALLMEDGSLFLMDDGTYFMLENETQAQSSVIPKINKSYWNF